MRNIVTQFFCLSISFYILVNVFPTDEFNDKTIIYSYVILFISWMMSIWLTHRHKPKYYQLKYTYIIAPFLKAPLIIFVLAFLIGLFFDGDILGSESILLIISLYSLIEIILFSFIIVYNTAEIKNSSVVNNTYGFKKDIQHDLEITPLNCRQVEKSVLPNAITIKIKEIYSNQFDSNCSIDGKLVNINEDFTFNNIDHNKYQLAFIENPLNGIKSLNDKLREAHSLIGNGCYLIVMYKDIETIEKEIRKMKSKISKVLAWLRYFINSTLPKIPIITKLYFKIPGLGYRILSRAEVWGRLSYYGFEVLDEKNEDMGSTVIVKKIKTISNNPNPSYYPIIKLDRVGFNGHYIKIHKFRSMFPYSEFIQKKVYEMNNLTGTGKLNEDFRISKIGSFLRRYWIDELPQFIDWLRGEIKLVGIRAMSLHYFSLYSKEYQELFVKVKPGILSPLFDANTNGFSDIERIEKEYLISYLRNPLITDSKLFFQTCKQIISGIRSK